MDIDFISRLLPRPLVDVGRAAIDRSYFRVFPNRKPAYLSDCWRFVNFEISPKLREPLEPLFPAPGEKPDLLIFPMTDWHTRIQRSQQLAIAFSALGYRCFYVNPHLGREYTSGLLSRRKSRLAILRPGIAELHVPMPREPIFHFRMLAATESKRLVDVITILAQTTLSKRVIQLVALPIWLDAVIELKRRFAFPIVYDCHDVLGGFDRMAPEIVAHEFELFEKADLVLFSSKPLMERHVRAHPGIGNKSLLIRNGTDFDHFNAAARDPAARGNPERTIGYAGSIAEWFDVRIVEEAAIQNPDCHFLMIGRLENDKAKVLGKLTNISFIGEVDYAKLPKYYHQFDAALIPFLLNDLTLGTNPIKLYEYFSLGLPVISTRLPEVEVYGDLVYVADGPERFAAMVRTALDEDDPTRRKRRIAVAKLESWEVRALMLQNPFEQLLANSRSSASAL
jgi:glycosyltransferase involved in cell wall biosynthesis